MLLCRNTRRSLTFCQQLSLSSTLLHICKASKEYYCGIVHRSTRGKPRLFFTWNTPRRFQIIASEKYRLAAAKLPRAPIPVDIFPRKRVDLLDKVRLDELPIIQYEKKKRGGLPLNLSEYFIVLFLIYGVER